jgi:chromosomal replication initiator protein
MDIGKIWNPKIADKVSSISFDCWIKTLVPESFTDGVFTLLAESKNAKEYATNDRHFVHIEAAIKDTAPVVEAVQIIDPVEKEERGTPTQTTKSKTKDKLNVNPNMTFDNFIVGKSNEVVAAAAEGVAKNPGKRINPLFIYGGVGLGKTHLLNAIANHVLAKNPELKIVLATSEKFTNDYIYTLAKGKNPPIEEFREKYRAVDILLIDDIQFIADKVSTQEEFFHTFNDLVQNERQVVLTSDRHPNDMPKLQERMRSRFKSGLVQDIGSPDIEMRTAILQKKAAMENHRLDASVASHLAKIAADTDTNIRDMEGMLFKVIFYAGLMNRSTPTLEDCELALKEGVQDKKVQTTADNIIDQVCKYFNITKQVIVGKRRNREFVEPRMIAIYLITEFLNIPLVSIGQLLGNRDHTTIMHGRNKIQSLLATDNRVKMIVKDISKMVRSE